MTTKRREKREIVHVRAPRRLQVQAFLHHNPQRQKKKNDTQQTSQDKRWGHVAFGLVREVGGWVYERVWEGVRVGTN